MTVVKMNRSEGSTRDPTPFVVRSSGPLSPVTFSPVHLLLGSSPGREYRFLSARAQAHLAHDF